MLFAHQTLETVCDRFGVPLIYLRMRVKDRQHVLCRAIAAHLLRRKHDLTFREIGEMLGGMDQGAASACALRGRLIARTYSDVGKFVDSVLRERPATAA